MKQESPSVVKFPDKYNEAAIELAKSILSRCESGEITEIVAVLTRGDGSYMTTATKTKNTAEQIGKLMVCVVDSIKFAEKE